jgi:hypothetical protein
LQPDLAEAYYRRASLYQHKNQRGAAVADLHSAQRLTRDRTLLQQTTVALAQLGEK